MTYKKTEDLLKLAILMQSNREGLSIKDIAERFRVSRRTAERMRDLIINEFPQCVEEKDGQIKRWHIPQGTLKDFIFFSVEEISLLETLKKLLVKNNMTDKAGTLDGVIDKIKANITDKKFMRIDPDAEVLMEAEGFICRPGPKLKTDLEQIKLIREAILNSNEICIKYHSRSKNRTFGFRVRPYGFLYGERKHYLIARYTGKRDDGIPRNFILSNIKAVKVCSERFAFDPDFNLQEYAEEAFGSYHEDPFDVEWLFDAEVADEASQYIFHPRQETIRNKDGTLTVKFRAGGRLEMDWHLYTWGKHVTVVKPENWREMIDETDFAADATGK